MIGGLVLPAFDLAVFIDAGHRYEAAFGADAVPEGAFVGEDLFAAGIDHGPAHGFYLFRGIHVFGDDAPFEILAVITAVPEEDNRIPVMAEGHEMHPHVEIELDVSVVDEIREIIIYQ